MTTKIVAQNKKAYFDYAFSDKIEAGLVLTGDEVKAIRSGQANLTGSFATVKDGELFILNCHISPYKQAYSKGGEQDIALRSRKLLLHKRELVRLISQMATERVQIVPLQLYLNARNIIKVELGIGKHKKAAGKKEALKERDIKRETARELRGRE